MPLDGGGGGDGGAMVLSVLVGPCPLLHPCRVGHVGVVLCLLEQVLPCCLRPPLELAAVFVITVTCLALSLRVCILYMRWE